MNTVVIVNTLAEFEQEVPPPAVVRLNLTEKGEPAEMFTYLHVNLDLQALNNQGHVVWLHDGQVLQRLHGAQDFWRPEHESLYGQMPQARRIVRDYLAGLGYEVRGGQFGLPADIKPVRGQFECLRWIKSGDNTLRVEAASAEEEASP